MTLVLVRSRVGVRCCIYRPLPSLLMEAQGAFCARGGAGSEDSPLRQVSTLHTKVPDGHCFAVVAVLGTEAQGPPCWLQKLQSVAAEEEQPNEVAMRTKTSIQATPNMCENDAEQLKGSGSTRRGGDSCSSSAGECTFQQRTAGHRVGGLDVLSTPCEENDVRVTDAARVLTTACGRPPDAAANRSDDPARANA